MAASLPIGRSVIVGPVRVVPLATALAASALAVSVASLTLAGRILCEKHAYRTIVNPNAQTSKTGQLYHT
jgi:hypothetical protein